MVRNSVHQIPQSTLGIVAAMDKEITPLTRRKIALRTPVSLSDRVQLIVSGMGARQAQAAGEQLLNQGITALLSWGTAAAIDPKLNAGAILLPKTIISGQNVSIETDLIWRKRLHVKLAAEMHCESGPLLESQHVVGSPQQKRELFQQTNCQAVDMESAALAGLAQANQIPFIAVRSVVDTADMCLPQCLMTAVDNDGQISVKNLTTGLLLRPWDWPAVVQLAIGFKAAKKSLQNIISLSGIEMSMPDIA